MKIKILSIALLLVLASCYVPAQKMLNLSVKKQDSLWLNGKELVKLNENGLEVITNFHRTKHGISSFDLSISNNTDKPILISPNEIYCVTSNKLNETKTIFAFNPEEILKNYDSKIEKLYAENKSNKRSELIFSFFDLAESYSNKTDEEIEQNRIEREEREDLFIKNRTRYVENVNRINANRNEIAIEALRKTTLQPNQKLSGKIYFKIPSNITSLVLYFPIQGRKMKIEYENIK